MRYLAVCFLLFTWVLLTHFVIQNSVGSLCFRLLDVGTSPSSTPELCFVEQHPHYLQFISLFYMTNSPTRPATSNTREEWDEQGTKCAKASLARTHGRTSLWHQGAPNTQDLHSPKEREAGLKSSHNSPANLSIHACSCAVQLTVLTNKCLPCTSGVKCWIIRSLPGAPQGFCHSSLIVSN